MKTDQERKSAHRFMGGRRIVKPAFVWAIVLCVLCAGCVPGDGACSADDLAGFFSGIWHGWIAPFSLILSFFNRELSIYERYNNGFWYDLGYYMAIISGFGGLSLLRKKDKKSD